MKKVWLVVALVALTGLAYNTYADVQNIRLSGDIRIRGYWLNNAADLDNSSSPNEDSYISQRTRITVEADLEDHVLVVVSLRGEGLWGGTSEEESFEAGGGASGAGLASFQRINRGYTVGINEAFVQLNEVFFTPATLKLGRQYLHYGRGLILSGYEQEYNHDAVRLVWDAYPFTLDLVYAKEIESSTFGSGSSARDTDLVFVNGRVEMTDSILRGIEAYFGWLPNGPNVTGLANVPPAAGFASPMLVGARADIDFTKNFQTWVEGAYEFGSNGGTADDISAWLANVGMRLALGDVAWTPAINAGYTYASGGGGTGENNFLPWFDYIEGYNGYLFAPALSNIHIINLGLSVKPAESTTLSIQGYYYVKVDNDSPAGSNVNIDFGGVAAPLTTTGKTLGWEVDGIIAYDYSKDVRLQLVGAVFIPGNAYKNDPTYSAATAQEVRAEVNVRF